MMRFYHVGRAATPVTDMQLTLYPGNSVRLHLGGIPGHSHLYLSSSNPEWVRLRFDPAAHRHHHPAATGLAHDHRRTEAQQAVPPSDLDPKSVTDEIDPTTFAEYSVWVSMMPAQPINPIAVVAGATAIDRHGAPYRATLQVTLERSLELPPAADDDGLWARIFIAENPVVPLDVAKRGMLLMRQVYANRANFLRNPPRDTLREIERQTKKRYLPDTEFGYSDPSLAVFARNAVQGFGNYPSLRRAQAMHIDSIMKTANDGGNAHNHAARAFVLAALAAAKAEPPRADTWPHGLYWWMTQGQGTPADRSEPDPTIGTVGDNTFFCYKPVSKW